MFGSPASPSRILIDSGNDGDTEGTGDCRGLRLQISVHSVPPWFPLVPATAGQSPGSEPGGSDPAATSFTTGPSVPQTVRAAMRAPSGVG